MEEFVSFLKLCSSFPLLVKEVVCGHVARRKGCSGIFGSFSGALPNDKKIKKTFKKLVDAWTRYIFFCRLLLLPRAPGRSVAPLHYRDTSSWCRVLKLGPFASVHTKWSNRWTCQFGSGKVPVEIYKNTCPHTFIIHCGFSSVPHFSCF